MIEQAHNPYCPPSDTRSHTETISSESPIYFAGTMTQPECLQTLELTTGTKNGGAATSEQLLGVLLAAAGLFAVLMFEALAYDEFDHLFELGAGLIGVSAVLGCGFLQRRLVFGRLAALEEKQEGYFTPMQGRVDADGIDYLIGNFPLTYRWEDLVGARTTTDAAVLFIDYPKEFNLLTASMFADYPSWRAALDRIEQQVPTHGRFPKLQNRKADPRLKHIAAGFRSLHEQDHLKASQEFEQALRIAPQDTQALRGRLVAAIAGSDTETAWDTVRELVSLGCEDKWTRRYRADLLMVGGRFAEALSDFDWLVENHPTDSDLLRDRGLCLHHHGDFKSALAAASDALALNPGDAIALNNRGAALMKLGRHAEATDSLLAAIEAAPEFDRPKELLKESEAVLGVG